MPKVLLTVHGTDESVVRPVVTGITREIFAITGIPDDTPIYYPGDLEKTYQAGTSIGSDDSTARLPGSAKMTVEVEENYEIDRLLSTAINRPENLFIFRDDRIDTYIKPAYSSTQVTINFRFRAIDKVTAQRWRDDIRARVSMMRDERIHEVTYSYFIPPEFLVVLQEIHRLRENVAPYNEDYDTFFKANSSQRCSLQSNLSGTQTAWAVAETQMRIMGWFDIGDNVPEKGEKEDDTDTWTVGFSYKFNYDKPIACVMAYPLIIHNQLLDTAFRPDKLPYRVEDRLRSYALSAKNFSVFEKGTSVSDCAPLEGVSIPAFDDFLPEQIVNPSMRVLTALVTIDTVDPLLLLSLKQLGDWTFDPDVLEFMAVEAPFMAQRYRSIFCLNLYQGPALVDDGLLTVDTDLNIRTIRALPLRDYYHLRLGLVTDLSFLTEAARTRLRNHGPALIKLLLALEPCLEEFGALPSLLGDSYVRKADLTRAIDVMNRANLAKGDGQIRQFNTVQTLFVTAQRN